MSTRVAADLQPLLFGASTPEIDEAYPVIPWNAPGMPQPGENFTMYAAGMAGTQLDVQRCLDYLYRRALYDEQFQMQVRRGPTTFTANLVPGHLLGDDTQDGSGGPREARVMVIGKHPGSDEVDRKRNFVGPTSQKLFEVLADVGVAPEEWGNWYATNVVHWQPEEFKSDLPAAWLKDNRVLLENEIRLVQPEFIICLGNDATRAVLGRGAPSGSTTGRHEILKTFDAQGNPREVKVFAVMHPAYVYREGAKYENYVTQFGYVMSVIRGNAVNHEADIVHKNIFKADELRRIVDAIRADPSRWLIGVDAEWHGNDPSDPGAYVRTVQFSSRDKEGYCVVLHHQGGIPAFKPCLADGVAQLKRLLEVDEDAGYIPRLGGHALRSDARRLASLGIDVRPGYRCADTPEGCRTTGGWETTCALHAVNESTLYGLEEQVIRFTTAPRYDKQVELWRDLYCATNKIKKKSLEGYGMCPEYVLYGDHMNYSAYDADVARRVIVRCFFGDQYGPPLLDADRFGNDCWRPYFNSHRANIAILEMETHGLTVDVQRLLQLTGLFQKVYDTLLSDFRQQVRWPDFNPRADRHRAALLFGDHVLRDKNGGAMRVSPDGAILLGLSPIKSTDGNCRKSWEQIVQDNESHKYNPSTDRESLGILSHQHPLAGALRDLRFIGHMLSTFLRPPGDSGVVITEDSEFDELDFEKGFGSYICGDGNVHSRLSTLKETGRMGSADPNCQNISKRREDDYREILGYMKTDKEGAQQHKGRYTRLLTTPLYKHPLRSVIKAPPGHILVETDYKVAEVAGLGWLAGDQTLIHEVWRSCLPEDHPDYLDIHAQMAVDAFRLDCAPTKKALQAMGRAGLRVAAKNVRFGVPYGRQAKAIMLQCREEGADVDVERAQSLIDFWHEKYAPSSRFLEEACRRVIDPGWIITPFGRLRRFQSTNDRTLLGEMQREAQNFGIQALVADSLYTAMYNFEQERKTFGLNYRILLPIHDALLFAVPIGEVADFIRYAVPRCMSELVPIWPCKLDGSPLPVTEPYYFSSSAECYLSWGEELHDADLKELGVHLYKQAA